MGRSFTVLILGLEQYFPFEGTKSLLTPNTSGLSFLNEFKQDVKSYFLVYSTKDVTRLNYEKELKKRPDEVKGLSNIRFPSVSNILLQRHPSPFILDNFTGLTVEIETPVYGRVLKIDGFSSIRSSTSRNNSSLCNLESRRTRQINGH